MKLTNDRRPTHIHNVRLYPAYLPIDRRRAGLRARLRRWLRAHDLTPERVVAYLVMVAAVFAVVWALSQAVRS